MNEAIQSERKCALVCVPPAGNISDMLFTSSVLGAEGQPEGAPAMINEENDPELMLALQLSLQEEEQRQARINASQAPAAVNNEEQELEERALQLAMEEEEKQEEKDDKKKEE